MPLWEATFNKGQQHTITFPRPMTLTGALLCVENPNKIDFDCNIEIHVMQDEGEKDAIVGVVGGSSSGTTLPVQKMGLNKSLPHSVPLTFYTKVIPVPCQKGKGLKSLRDADFKIQVSGFSD